MQYDAICFYVHCVYECTYIFISNSYIKFIHYATHSQEYRIAGESQAELFRLHVFILSQSVSSKIRTWTKTDLQCREEDDTNIYANIHIDKTDT